jgi:carnitine-CoA ligase
MIDTTDSGTPPQDTINAALQRAVEAVPNRVFLDFSGDLFTFADVDRLATELAHGLRGEGVKVGDPVATVLLNNIDAVVAWLALNKIGAISAPVNTAFKGDSLQSQIEDCGATIVIVEDDLAERVREIAGRLPALRSVFVRSGNVTSREGDVSFRPLSDLRNGCLDPIPDEARPATLAMLVYTSGTTGRSKGCMVPHNAVCNLGWNAAISRSLEPTDIIWTPLPLFHLNAIGVSVAGALVAQCRCVVAPRFSLSGFWPEIERSGATTIGLLGSIAALIADAPDSESARACFGQLRNVSAAPFPPEVRERWKERFGLPAGSAARGYGMTEASTISGLLPGDPEGPDDSSGRIGIDYDVMIADDEGVPVATGSAGEILCRPRRPNILFQGYWHRHDETIKAFRDMWFHTGDIGKVDDQGYLYFLDRKKDYIRRRGENISSMEVEAVFQQHPAVRDVAVHAVLSPVGEDDVKATIELSETESTSEEELCRWSMDRLPYFAVPLYIEFRDELPRGPTGKVLKAQLRSEGKTDATWDREEAGLALERR